VLRKTNNTKEILKILFIACDELWLWYSKDYILLSMKYMQVLLQFSVMLVISELEAIYG